MYIETIVVSHYTLYKSELSVYQQCNRKTILQRETIVAESRKPQPTLTRLTCDFNAATLPEFRAKGPPTLSSIQD